MAGKSVDSLPFVGASGAITRYLTTVLIVLDDTV